MAAARAWAKGTLVAAPKPQASPEPAALADARLWGASEEELVGIREQIQGPIQPQFALWPCNLDIVSAWCLVARQWRTGVTVGSAGIRTLWIGLDFLAVRSVLAAYRIRLDSDLMFGLQLMERAALAELNDQSI